MKFFRWLHDKKAEKMPERVVEEKSARTEGLVIVEKMQIIEATEKLFVDEVTGKTYKTERGLKGAITRRLNKAKKTKERKNVKKS